MIVTNIQRFCVNDGPGIRTTVFFKGCSIHCPWCANPENILPSRQYYFKRDKCKRNNGNCVFNSDCIVCNSGQELYKEKKQLDKYKCVLGAIGIYGDEYEVGQLKKELLKDRIYWRNNGGVTFSGGEPLLQGKNFNELLKSLKEEEINIVLETALFVNKEKLYSILPYVDLFYVDIKILDKNKCEDILGGDIDQYYNNLELLKDSNKKVVFRIPCNKEYTFTAENLGLIKKLLLKYKDNEVEIFQIHELAEDKYLTLGKEVFRTEKIETLEMENFIKWCEDNGISAKIISI